MTPAERKATEAVVRAAKAWDVEMFFNKWKPAFPEERMLLRAVSRLLREEAKTKEKKRGK